MSCITSKLKRRSIPGLQSFDWYKLTNVSLIVAHVQSRLQIFKEKYISNNIGQVGKIKRLCIIEYEVFISVMTVIKDFGDVLRLIRISIAVNVN